MKKIPDAVIERELSKWLHEMKKLDRIKFINRHGVVIDIG
jgi:hypothetical protein